MDIPKRTCNGERKNVKGKHYEKCGENKTMKSDEQSKFERKRNGCVIQNNQI